MTSDQALHRTGRAGWRRRLGRASLLSLLGAAVGLVGSAGPAFAATNITISGSMEGATKASPGDWISAGYDFTMPGAHAAGDVTFVGAQVVVHYMCDADHSITGDIIIPLAGGPYTDPAGSSSWFPGAGSQQVAAVWQGAVAAPDVCGGGLLSLANGATFTADVQSTNTVDDVHVRFHYDVAASKGSHLNLNCSSTTDNPDPNGVGACSASWSATVSLTPDAVTGVSMAPPLGGLVGLGTSALFVGGAGAFVWRRRHAALASDVGVASGTPRG